jgi:hypothetical protein
MIQRIQSVFLLVAAVLSALMLTGIIMETKDVFGNLYTLDFKSLTVSLDGKEQVQNLWPLAAIFAAVPVACLISIFLYKNRRLQMKFTMASLMLSLGSAFVAGFYLIMLTKKIEMTYIWHLKVILPLATAIFCCLAHRSVQKDEEKIRSLDRIR